MKIPGWNEIQCLFEQIDEKQLPDKNNLLSILKVCAYGRITFLKAKKLPLNAPYDSYKDEYLIFRKKFFEEAVKKWQNVTLDTFEDLHKVLMYLSHKERRESRQVSQPLTINNILSHLPSALEKNACSDSITNNIFDQSDDDSLFELSFAFDENGVADKNDLFVHLEQLSSDIINNKLRQDSGFYEFNSDESCHSLENISSIDLPPTEISANFAEINTDVTMSNVEAEIVQNDLLPATTTDTNNTHFEPFSTLGENKENEPPIEVINNDDFDKISVISDHDYCANTNAKPNSQRSSKRKLEESIRQLTRKGSCIVCKTTHLCKLPKEKKVPSEKEVCNCCLYYYFLFH